MVKQEINIQDSFLFQSLKSGSPVQIVLTTGESLTGALKRFDRFALVVEEEGRETMVYKHAVALIRETAES